MQENEKVNFASEFRKGLTLLSVLFVLVAALGLLGVSDDETNGEWLPLRSVQKTVHEIPGHKFRVRTRFEYKLDGEWLTKDVTYTPETFGWAKRLELYPLSENSKVRFNKEFPNSFEFSDSEGVQNKQDSTRLTCSLTLLVIAWLVFAMRRLSFPYASMVYLFLVSIFVGWLGVFLLADQLKVAREVGSWTRVEAHLDFYQMDSFCSINTRFRYSLEGNDYSGGWVALKAQPLLPPHTVAWAMLAGDRTVTCYVNPDNPKQSCLTRFNSLAAILPGILILIALGIQWLLYRVIFRKGVPLNSTTKHWGAFAKLIAVLAAVYMLTWAPSFLVFLQTSSAGSAMMVIFPTACLFVFVGALVYRGRREHRQLRVLTASLAAQDRRS